jgi:hypothetical protein
MKPIETRYKGYRFRSRLEARWAVFFDALGLAWEYEKEGYSLPSGNYLPDFWMPKLGLFIEIKGPQPTKFEIRLAQEMSERTGTVAIFHGVPLENEGVLASLDVGSSSCGTSTWACWWASWPFPAGVLIAALFPGRVLVQPDWSTAVPGVIDAHEFDVTSDAPWLVRAAAAARSARFEFGESGAA